MVKVVYTCDAWKTKDSLRLIGVFSNQNDFFKGIKKLNQRDWIQLTK